MTAPTAREPRLDAANVYLYALCRAVAVGRIDAPTHAAEVRALLGARRVAGGDAETGLLVAALRGLFPQGISFSTSPRHDGPSC